MNKTSIIALLVLGLVLAAGIAFATEPWVNLHKDQNLGVSNERQVVSLQGVGDKTFGDIRGHTKTYAAACNKSAVFSYWDPIKEVQFSDNYGAAGTMMKLSPMADNDIPISTISKGYGFWSNWRATYNWGMRVYDLGSDGQEDLNYIPSKWEEWSNNRSSQGDHEKRLHDWANEGLTPQPVGP